MTETRQHPHLHLLQEKIQHEGVLIENLIREINKNIIGQQYMIERLLIGLLGAGHILLEGVPGLAKTLAIKTLSAAIDASFSRIQFTPDLLPADVVGTMIYTMAQNSFTPKKGPVFAHFVLADEINRAPEKVQSALLEAMQERQVTIGDQTFPLEEPFLVLATQNPIEQGGTYSLPEAQVDRFMLKVVIAYPTQEEEKQIIRQNLQPKPTTIEPVLTTAQILQIRQTIRDIYMDEAIEDYIVKIVFATRTPAKSGLQKLVPLLSFGASPRGSISLAIAAKVNAFLKKRAYVLPEDVRSVCMDVLRHRIGLTYEAQAENVRSEDIIQEVLNTVSLP